MLTFWWFAQAVQQYGDIDIFTANFRPLKATLSGLPDRVFMKLVVCAKTNEVLGLHMCGDDAPEIVQVFRVATAALYCFDNDTWVFNSLYIHLLDAQGSAVAIKADLTKIDCNATVQAFTQLQLRNLLPWGLPLRRFKRVNLLR